ncbi:hypothetical protein SCA6_010047 [Theobroma cacao]
MHAHLPIPVRKKKPNVFGKMDGLKKILIRLMMVAMSMKMVHGRDPVRHDVGGGRYGWKPDVNFSEWSNHQLFYVGDWLYFGFDKNLYSVLEVNKTSYEKCNETDFMTNITRGGRDVFELKEARPYYFISGRGFCFDGMKVAVRVEDTPPAPAPSPGKNSGSPSSCLSQILLPLLTTSVFLIFLSKYY